MKIFFIFFQNGNKNCRVGTKIRVGRVSGNTAIFSTLGSKKCVVTIVTCTASMKVRTRCKTNFILVILSYKKVQVGKDQEKAQSEKDSHSKTKVGKNQTNNQACFQFYLSILLFVQYFVHIYSEEKV